MSAQLPIIDRWEANGWEWQHIFYPTTSPFVVPANGEVQIPSEKYIFKYREGAMLNFQAGFDSPYCGIRLKWAPNFDFLDRFTVNNIALGMSTSDPLIYAFVPPDTFAYTLRIPSQWKWEDTLEMYLNNTDSEDHYCLGYGYIIAGTNKKLKEPERLTAEKLLLYMNLYPEMVPDLKKKMRKQAEAELEPLGLSIKS